MPETQPAPAAQPTDMPAASAEMQATGTSGRQLPQTASELPLVGFAGLLALGGALLLRTLRTAL
jgi:LPXTG-motif cell wall-anchored protein